MSNDSTDLPPDKLANFKDATNFTYHVLRSESQNFIIVVKKLS